MKRDFVYLLLIAGLAIILLLRECHSAKREEFISVQQQILEDSLKITTNKLGQQTAEIRSINTSYDNFKKLSFQTSDSLGKQLQKLANRRTITATIATQLVKVDTVFKTDSVLYANGDSCNPVYVKNDTTDYRTISVRASKDSFEIAFKEYEKLRFETEWSKWRPFKNRTATTSYFNSNPDVEITGLRTYTVSCDCKKQGWLMFGLGGAGGFLAGFGAGYGYKALK